MHRPSRPPARLARRLAALVLLAAGAAAPAVAQSASGAESMENYRLTMANIERLVPLSKALYAVQNDADVQAYIKAKSAEMQADNGDKSDPEANVAKLTQMLNGQPKLRQAFVTAGITPRDYAYTTGILMINQMAVLAEQQSKQTATPPAGVAGQNWALVHRNQPRILEISKELEKYPVKLSADSQ